MTTIESIWLGFVIGYIIIGVYLRYSYHFVKRINNKAEDKELAERLKKIESEMFDFEKEIE